ncbi:hypothetical protein N836_21060 [Leptolyngbya sp. Heron Island J]|nr:hypothetical protein N836_21060 [Leptolyngbya sp. Heron Island J]
MSQISHLPEDWEDATEEDCKASVAAVELAWEVIKTIEKVAKKANRPRLPIDTHG